MELRTAPMFGYLPQGLRLWFSIWLVAVAAASATADPIPKPWPLQFHSKLFQNQSGTLSVVDLWYDYPNGRNLNLIQFQLGSTLHDVEYNNHSSFYYDLEAGTCRRLTFPVGLLPPDWLSDGTYVGVEEIDGFKCNTWDKVNFIRYWEDVVTQRPVSMYFRTTGQWMQFMSFEEGNVLDDQSWQAPVSCFEQTTVSSDSKMDEITHQPVFSARNMI